jgi:hypothetical protein
VQALLFWIQAFISGRESFLADCLEGSQWLHAQQEGKQVPVVFVYCLLFFRYRDALSVRDLMKLRGTALTEVAGNSDVPKRCL